MKHQEINGIMFEVVTGNVEKDRIMRTVALNGVNKGLFDIYARPSYKKMEIFDFWKQYFFEISGACGCVSGNTSTFSIAGRADDIDGRPAVFYITKGHNKVVFTD